jgi:hypothetical protein
MNNPQSNDNPAIV